MRGMEATRIIAIRHGETAWNVAGRLQGHTDEPLNERGQWQARQTAQALADEELAAIYSSDLRRAQATAHAIAQASGAPLTLTPELRERCFGRMEGYTFPELEAAHPEQARRWRQRDPAFAPEGGESLRAMRDRILAATARLAAPHLGQQIVLVAHGGVLDMLYRHATGQPLEAPRGWPLENAAINRLLWTPTGQLTVVGWAHTIHLENQGERLDERSH